MTSDRHPLRPDLIDVDAYRRDHGLGADNLPLNLNPQEREAAQEQQAMPEATPVAVPAVSPTGAPLVSQGVLKIVGGILFAIASAVAIKQPDLFPQTELDQQVAVIVLAALGFLSPGLRKPAA